jgi:hypothetical protein
LILGNSALLLSSEELTLAFFSAFSKGREPARPELSLPASISGDAAGALSEVSTELSESTPPLLSLGSFPRMAALNPKKSPAGHPKSLRTSLETMENKKEKEGREIKGGRGIEQEALTRCVWK